MTCIVGIERTGASFIGGDSAVSDTWTVRQSSVRKVFRKGDYTIGYTTSFRMGQILEHMIPFPECKEPTEDFMVRELAAPVVVVVHGGQIVMDQRIGMDQLKGRGERQDGWSSSADRFVGRDGQDRPHALAPGEQAVAHGLVQIRRRRGLGRHDRVEKAVNVLPFLFQILLNVHAGGSLTSLQKRVNARREVVARTVRLVYTVRRYGMATRRTGH